MEYHRLSFLTPPLLSGVPHPLHHRIQPVGLTIQQVLGLEEQDGSSVG
jgi:hypothetical protein